MPSRLRLRDYLVHIATAIEHIQEYTAALTKDDFFEDRLVQDAVIRNLEVIGEASHQLRTHHADFVAEHPDLPLGEAYEMRNALAHGYFVVDLNVVWETISHDLQPLRIRVIGLVSSEDITPASPTI